jgi:uncharacterized delta-60 repeat protein
LDLSFDVGTGFDGEINCVTIQPNGKLLVGGNFTNFNGVPRQNIARLNSDGSLDYSFNPGLGFSFYPGGAPFPSEINSIILSDDQKIIATGNFSKYNNQFCGGQIVKLDTTGQLDTSFIMGNIAADTDRYAGDTIYLAGFYRKIPLISGISLVIGDFKIPTIALKQADGKIVVNSHSFGTFARNYYGFTQTNTALTRISASTGFFDNTYNVPSFPITSAMIDSNFIPLSQQTDGKIIVSGGPFKLNRLNTNGSIDGTFNLTSGPNDSVTSAVVQSDGKIVIGGKFTSFGGTPRNSIARILTDRSLDPSFSIGTGFNLPVNSVTIQPDGKIIAGGEFITYNSTVQNRIVRLNTDGSIDTSFHIGLGFDDNVNLVLLLADEKILVSGKFTNYNGVTRNKLARLNGTPAATSNVKAISHSATVRLYPNPTSTKTQIICSELMKKIEVYDVFGRVLINHSCDANDVTIDVSLFDNGIYIVRINDSIIAKLVKQ